MWGWFMFGFWSGMVAFGVAIIVVLWLCEAAEREVKRLRGR